MIHDHHTETGKSFLHVRIDKEFFLIPETELLSLPLSFHGWLYRNYWSESKMEFLCDDGLSTEIFRHLSPEHEAFQGPDRKWSIDCAAYKLGRTLKYEALSTAASHSLIEHKLIEGIPKDMFDSMLEIASNTDDGYMFSVMMSMRGYPSGALPFQFAREDETDDEEHSEIEEEGGIREGEVGTGEQEKGETVNQKGGGVVDQDDGEVVDQKEGDRNVMICIYHQA